MPSVRSCAMDDTVAFDALRIPLEQAHPDLRFGRFACDNAEIELEAAKGTKVFWIYRGEGEVFIPSGYRTKEGDGHSLPETYIPEPLDVSFAATLSALQVGLDSIREDARGPLLAILERECDAGYVGDMANDLWKLEHIPRPWSADPIVERAIETLWRSCPAVGFSKKRGAAWEKIMEGDQLVVAGDESLQVRGNFACLTVEYANSRARHVPSVMRLRYLRDSSGGCNFDFDPFRRLPLTWYMERPGDRSDGINFANSHVVNIAKETSPSHFHPPNAVGGGKPQHEIYLVLDPAAFGLNTHGRTAQLIVWPDLNDLSRHDIIELRPGDFVHIPPGTGHRGIDVFVNVITIPGFKPHNEYYIDADIRETGRGAPFNESLVALKNYDKIEALLG